MEKSCVKDKSGLLIAFEKRKDDVAYLVVYQVYTTVPRLTIQSQYYWNFKSRMMGYILFTKDGLKLISIVI